MILKREPEEFGFMDIDESTLYEWANLRSQTTGQPFDIWVDEIGKNRNTKHNDLRIKATANNIQLDVIIHNNGTIEYANDNKDIRKFGHKRELEDFIFKVSPALRLHWNQEIDSGQLATILKTVKKSKVDIFKIIEDVLNDAL